MSSPPPFNHTPPYLYSLGYHFITFHIPLSSHATPTKLMAPPPLVPHPPHSWLLLLMPHPPCFKTIVSLGIPSQEPPPQTVHCIVFSEGREGGRVVWSNETAEEQGNIPNTVVSIVRLMQVWTGQKMKHLHMHTTYLISPQTSGVHRFLCLSV